jgi:hypothetical protein
LTVRDRARGGDLIGESRNQVAAGDGAAVGGALARRDTVANGECLLQQRLHLTRPDRPRMRVGDLAAPSDQMRQTGLVRGLGELAIRGPAVADEHAIEIGTEHGGRFVEPAPVLNGVHDGACRREHPQPPELSAYLPTRFVRTDHRTAAHLLAQHLIGRCRLARGAMEGVAHTAGPHLQPEPVVQQRRDLAVRQPELFIEAALYMCNGTS